MNLFRFTAVATSAVITPPPPPPPPEFIRGGRLRKTSKGLVSFAPFLAGASALALGALLTTTSPVEAGSCATAGQPAGTARCADGADDSDSTEELEAPENSSFTVTDADNFGLNVQAANMKGIVITTEATTTDLIVDLDGNVGATDTALEIDMDGTGATTVTMDGTLTSTTGVGLSADVAARATGAVMITTSAITSSGNGIRLVPRGSGAVTITANGNIDSDANAISVSGQEESSGNVNIIASGTLDGERGGIHLIQAGTGAVDVEASGNITSASGRGVYVASSKGISVDIDTTGSTVQAKNEGVRVGHDGAGFIKVTTDDVTSTDSYGIRVAGSLAQTGNLEVTANGDITGGITGIWTYTPGTGETIVTTAAGTTVTGGHTAMGSNAYALRVANQGNLGNRDDADGHIHVTTDGNLGTSSSRTEGGMWVTPRSFGDAMVTVNGDVFASADSRGVFVEGGGIGALNVYINGDVDGGTHGVDVEQVLRTSSYFSADNVIRLTVAGSVEGDIGVQVSGANAVHDSTITVTGTSSITGTDGTALDLGGVADHNVTLQSGSTLTGKIDASGATGAVSLDISGAINVTSGNAH